MEHDEIEVKYHIIDAAVMQQRLISAGASSSGRIFEKNIRFEDAADSLIKKKSLLRLRQDSKTTLTFKQASASGDSQFKIYREIETEVGDFDATRRILESLGYFPRQIYEKYRETFTLKNAALCLDTMPYGNFLEIEGDKTSIRELTDQLGLNWTRRILATYLELFEYIRKEALLTFDDLTFANFKDIRHDFADSWKHFEQSSG